MAFEEKGHPKNLQEPTNWNSLVQTVYQTEPRGFKKKCQNKPPKTFSIAEHVIKPDVNITLFKKKKKTFPRDGEEIF